MTLVKKYLFFVIALGFIFHTYDSKGQKTDTIATFSVTGYIDAYYAYYTDSAGPGGFQKFSSTSPISNSPSLNTAQIAVHYTSNKIRCTAVLHAGDISSATWAPAPYRHLMEAHLGVKVCNKLWIDGGFFRAHFGTEFLLPSENLTSSLSIGTFYDPYYESALRLNFDPTKKLEINLFLLNGYGVFVDNNHKKSLGMGVTYALSDKGDIGYTNYLGDDSPIPTAVSTNTSHLRFHNNIFLNYKFSKVKLQVGGDYCLQQNSDLATGSRSAGMFTALATCKYLWTKRFAIYGRGEIFNDPDGYMSTIISDRTGKRTGYKLIGLTIGAEYKPSDESYVRLEARGIQMDKDQYIFNYNGVRQNSRFEVMVNAGITFDLVRTTITTFTNSAKFEETSAE